MNLFMSKLLWYHRLTHHCCDSGRWKRKRCLRVELLSPWKCSYLEKIQNTSSESQVLILKEDVLKGDGNGMLESKTCLESVLS